MTMTKEQVVYRLNALCRYDEDVKAFVGYIPRLRVYTQAITKESLPKAIHATALQFILACANKGILSSLLHETGAEARYISAADAKEAMEQDTEFVAVMGYQECMSVDIPVPLSLIAAQEACAVA